MPILSDNQLKQSLADILRVDVGDLPFAWESIVTAANSQAQADINAGLGALGFNAVQIAAWDRLAVYNRSIGLYHALTDGAILIDFDSEKLDRLDRRQDFDKDAKVPFQFTAGGIVLPPAASFAGGPVGGRGVASGRITAGDSRITMDTEF